MLQEAPATLQEAPATLQEAKDVLKHAIQLQHKGSELSAKFTRAIVCAAVDLGLQARTGLKGYKLQHVTFTSIGPALTSLKKSSSMANSKTAAVIETLQLQQYFSFKADIQSDKHLIVHIAKVLPDASTAVRSILPDVKWLNPGPVPPSAVANQSTHVSTQTKALTPPAAYDQHAVLGDQTSGPCTSSEFASSDVQLSEHIADTEGAKSASPPRLTVCPLTCQCDSKDGSMRPMLLQPCACHRIIFASAFAAELMRQISQPPSACNGVRTASAGEGAHGYQHCVYAG